jgi:hypothetical protein
VLEARVQRAFHVFVASAANFRASPWARRVVRKGSVAIGSRLLDHHTVRPVRGPTLEAVATTTLREDGRANGGADAKPGCRWCVRGCCGCATMPCCLERPWWHVLVLCDASVEWTVDRSTEHRGTTTCAYHWLHRSWVQARACNKGGLFEHSVSACLSCSGGLRLLHTIPWCWCCCGAPAGFHETTASLCSPFTMPLSPDHFT